MQADFLPNRVEWTPDRRIALPSTDGIINRIFRLPSNLALYLIHGYKRWISPLLGNVCRFHPPCSSYAAEVIETYGLIKGGWYSFKRICKCHPFHPGGIDYPPVPHCKQAHHSSYLSEKPESE